MLVLINEVVPNQLKLLTPKTKSFAAQEALEFDLQAVQFWQGRKTFSLGIGSSCPVK